MLRLIQQAVWKYVWTEKLNVSYLIVDWFSELYDEGHLLQVGSYNARQPHHQVFLPRVWYSGATQHFI